jgi:hypothetical protein
MQIQASRSLIWTLGAPSSRGDVPNGSHIPIHKQLQLTTIIIEQNDANGSAQVPNMDIRALASTRDDPDGR